MDAQLKAKWVEALRSGKYQQARQTLQDFNGANCCLGVLARIQGQSFDDFGMKAIESRLVSQVSWPAASGPMRCFISRG